MGFELSIASDMEDEINKEARAVASHLLTGFIKKTPVDTGRAKGNWFLSTGAPNRTIDKDRRQSAALSEGQSIIGKAAAIEYPTITLSNNLPYIEKLNDGHSTQAPKKFVETEIQRVTNARQLTNDGR